MNILIPRLPTKSEKDALVSEILTSRSNDFEYIDLPPEEAIREAVDEAYIAVFDNYTAKAHEDFEKVMVVIWGRSPSSYEVFIWQDGLLLPINQLPHFRRPELES